MGALVLKAVWLAAWAQLLLGLTVRDFKPALFHSTRPSGFYQLTTGRDNSGIILALDDLNNDQYTDYIAAEDLTRAALTAFLWDDPSSQFLAVPLPLNQTGFQQVAEVLICEIDGDGLLELIVTFRMAAGTYSSQIYDVICTSTACSVLLKALDYALLSGMSAPPFLVDVAGSGRLSMLAFTGGSRLMVRYDRSASPPVLQSSSFASLLASPPSSFNAAPLHFASSVDFNGDCSSDLVLVSGVLNVNSVVEFYGKGNGESYMQLAPLSVGKNITWLSFVDLDANGAVDLFLVAQEGSAFTPYAIFNPHVPSDICEPTPSFPFSAALRPLTLPSGYALTASSNIKFADVNFDGLPDMVGVFLVGKFLRAGVLVGGSGGFGELGGQNAEAVGEVEGAVQACPFDLGEDGRVDVLVVSQAATVDGGVAYVRTAVFNNIIDDSLFIKILPVLPSAADFDSGQRNSATGVTVQWRITNLNGDKTIALLNQKSQWNYGSLQLPFVTAGLGRTNNYIEDLAVGYPGRGQVEVWTPVIPNSQLLVRREQAGEWELETLLKDNSRVYDVVYISIVCLLVLGLVVFYLNWRENQEDKRDHYNFIQMIR